MNFRGNVIIMEKSRSMQIFILLLISFIFVTVFSYSTSPLYGNICDNPDPAIFQIIGKYWAEGILPYRDLWDLKGPYIFWVNAIGYYLFDSYIGVYIIQIINLWFILIITFLTYRLYFQTIYALLLCLLSLFSLSYSYQCGNLCEEYLLLFLSISFYFLLKYIKKVEIQNNYYHCPYVAIIYGIVLGLSLMSRLTNALSVCGAVAVVSIILIIHQCYDNLFKNFLFFFIGFAISSFPFIVYFYLNDALDLLWNGILFYPLQYASNSTKDMSDVGIHFFLLSFGNSILLLFISVIAIYRQHQFYFRYIIWFLASLLPFIWFCQGNGFGHYGMTVFPLFTISLIEMKRLRMKKLFIFIVFLVFIGFLSKLRFAFHMRNYQNSSVIAYKEFLKDVHNINYNSFVTYNCDPNFYIAENIKPAVSFFSLQDFAIKRNENLREEIVKAFTEKHPQWILLEYDNEIIPAIHGLLNHHYQIVKYNKVNKLTLYKYYDDY